jgi:hypothetical protein
MSVSATFAISSGIVQLSAHVPILIGIFRGQTKPSTTATGIWTFVSFALLASSYSSGVRTNLPFLISGCLATTTVFILSLKYGYRRWSLIDPICVFLGVISLITWFLTRQASYAVYLLTLLDWIAILPVVYKSWYDPKTENKLGWSISFFATLLVVLSIRDWRLVVIVVAFSQISHSLIINTLIRLPSHHKKVIGIV